MLHCEPTQCARDGTMRGRRRILLGLVLSQCTADVVGARRRSPLSVPLSSKAYALQLRGGTAGAATPSTTSTTPAATPPPKHEALQLRGGTATTTAPTSTTPATTPPAAKKKHAYITPRELTQIMVADLAPHGMLPLAWAATRGAGTGVVPAIALLVVFASSSAYTL